MKKSKVSALFIGASCYICIMNDIYLFSLLRKIHMEKTPNILTMHPYFCRLTRKLKGLKPLYCLMRKLIEKIITQPSMSASTCKKSGQKSN